MSPIAVALIASSYALVAVAVALFVHETQRPAPPVEAKPAPVLWICDQCGVLARAQPTTAGVLDLQAVREAHDCVGAADLVSDVERYLIAQAPPP